MAEAQKEVGQSPRNAGDLVVLGRGGLESLEEGVRAENELGRTLGVLGERVVDGRVGASVLVVKAQEGGRKVSAVWA
jgi:hypothetical protein